ncbi:choice-of-anchor tandem repeat GloVer-containing protein [Methylocystis heyeri]|uniref:Uncharacterized protein n=1 Tax=Methylocystis heyeri TaxID=391905 RepID=A0A6B8KDI9_9HYPH|nr:choice-of-anchor tandem repeat GloVer-containing protein [Methylocystis heyeri]QGM45759.1 hypothetical protein H2LOC_008620 [Methylocystis heyeri]
MKIRANFKSSACLSLMSVLFAGASVEAFGQSWPPAPLSEGTLYSFTGGADGGAPQYVSLLADSNGALYGTATGGGAHFAGVAFKLTPPGFGKTQWTESVLYTFSGADGAVPIAGLLRDLSGALYGVTAVGGANGFGVAFKLSPPVPPSTQWSYARIFDFAQSTGANPYGALIWDGAGGLVGAATTGGRNGVGAIYKLTPPASTGGQWTVSTLYNFTGGADGGSPYSSLVAGAGGAIYGTASAGGSGGAGVVFKLTPPGANCTPVSPNRWCETVLHAFGGSDGAGPYASLTLDDASGTFYGTTSSGGASNQGAVFSLTPPVPPSTLWVETVLHSFAGGQDGAQLFSPLVLFGGALYGASRAGGGTGCGGSGCGALFKVTPPAAPSNRWAEQVLYAFTGGADGAAPYGGLTVSTLHFGLGAAIYGVANGGGASNAGTIFSLQCATPAREVFGGAQHVACAH